MAIGLVAEFLIRKEFRVRKKMFLNVIGLGYGL